MKMLLKKRWVKVTFWLVTEIILNLVGLDNLADYSEFIFEQELAITTNQHQITAVALLHRPQFYQDLHYRFTLNA
ncbi:MAG TPA: hypothetical protein V6D14_18025 [Coleofasciculaceae cyanobacterium]|jgi:hypothetical protein